MRDATEWTDAPETSEETGSTNDAETPETPESHASQDDAASPEPTENPLSDAPEDTAHVFVEPDTHEEGQEEQPEKPSPYTPFETPPPFTPLSSFHAARRRNLGDRWRDWMTHPLMRGILTAGVVILLGGLLTLGLLIFRPSGEPLDDFIHRWNNAVETNETAKFDALLTRELVAGNAPPAYLRAWEFLGKLHKDGKQVAPVEGDIEEVTSAYLLSAEPQIEGDTATLTVKDEENTVAMRLVRAGWGRKWHVADVETATKPTPDEAVAGQTSINGANGESGNGAAVPNGTPLDTDFKLKQILEAWRVAWEKGQLDAYMAWYADYASVTRVTVVDGREIPETLTKAQLRNRMERLYRKYNNVQVGVSNVNVQGDYAEADVNFRQDYSAYTVSVGSQPVYHDIGIKTLKFVNEKGEWKIYEENWRSYVNVPSYPLN